MMINDMNMKNFLFIVALIALQINVHAVTVKATDNLNVYYPEYTKLDLVCGQMPKTTQKDVDFCCESAFTGELLNEFKHSNIADNHICNGVMKKGYRCRANTGGFVWGNGKKEQQGQVSVSPNKEERLKIDNYEEVLIYCSFDCPTD